MKFAILGDAVRLQRWQLDCIEKLHDSKRAAASVLLNLPCAEQRLRTRGDWIFRRIWGSPAAGSQQFCMGTSGALAALPVIGIEVIDEHTIAAIRRHELDFILCFADPRAPQVRSLLECARHGVWAFNFGDWENLRGGPPGFWEIAAGASVTAAMLMRLREDPDEVTVLRQGVLRTKRISYRQNSEHVLSRCTHWPLQRCIDIDSGSSLEPRVLRSRATWREAPSAAEVVKFGCTSLAFAVLAAWRALFQSDRWNIGIVNEPIRNFIGPPPAQRQIHWLPARGRNEFIADPYGVMRDGKLTIVCEHFDYRDGRGALVACCDPNSAALRPVAIGPRPPVHLSFPFLLQAEGRLYCVPESCEAGEVALYAEESFPLRWVKVATLLEKTAVVDPTLFRYGDTWWLAAADVGLKSPSADLFLWYSTALTGPWHAHAGNPVKTDVRSARPAGTPFMVDGVLYRPAMDCSDTYGGRVRINRVIALTPTTFCETEAATVAPDPRCEYPDGLHTLSAVGEITLIDGKRLTFVPAALLKRFWNRKVAR